MIIQTINLTTTTIRTTKLALIGVIWIWLFVMLSSTIGCSGNYASISVEEHRYNQLNKLIVCPICPGESIDQSQATISSQMRTIVNEKISQGWTDDQIKDFFVERYGPSVIMEPPTHGFGLLAWIVAPIIIGAGVAGLATALVQMRKRSRKENSSTACRPSISTSEQRQYSQYIESLIEGEEA